MVNSPVRAFGSVGAFAPFGACGRRIGHTHIADETAINGVELALGYALRRRFIRRPPGIGDNSVGLAQGAPKTRGQIVPAAQCRHQNRPGG